jgi:lipopolysaccharide export system permease protein
MVIARYISKEIFSTFFAIIFILLFIAISNKFVMYLAKAASGKLPVAMVFKIVGLYIPELFSILAPVAMFIAILFTHSRLHADNEVAILLTSGFNWAQLTRTTILASSVIAILVAVINFVMVPAISAKREKLLADGQVAGVISAITPGRFQTIEDNDHLVFYVENVLADGKLHNIFIAQQPNSDKAGAEKSVVVLTAKTASVKPQNDPNEFYLVLHNGYRYVGTPGTANYSVTSFTEYGRQLKYASGAVGSDEDIRPSGEVFKSGSPADIAELQWRCAMPIALLVLALIAIPLAKVQPRQGRYAKFLPAVLIYMVYYNLLTVVRRFIANGQIHSFPGIWAVHIVFIAFGIALLLHVSGRWAQFKYKMQNT